MLLCNTDPSTVNYMRNMGDKYQGKEYTEKIDLMTDKLLLKESEHLIFAKGELPPTPHLHSPGLEFLY